MKPLDKKERSEIFKMFLDTRRLKFNEIEKRLGIRSNMVSYHLTSMVKDNFLEKKGDYYHLTKDAEKYIPIFSQLYGQELGPLPVILVAVMHAKNILLIKRNKRPYKDYWSMIGGKISMHENYREASLRKVFERTRLGAEFVSLNNILHEHVEESGTVKHSFILIFTKVNSKRLKFRQTAAGELKWFSIDKLPEKIIPSDIWLIKHSLNTNMRIPSILMSESVVIIESYTMID